MAQKTTKGGMLIPSPVGRATAALSLNSIVLDGASEKAAGVFTAPKTGTIVKVGFLVGAVTQGDDIDIRLETVDSAGNPSGTLANASDSNLVITLSTTGWKTVELTGTTSVTQGDLLAVVIVNGPDVTVGNFTINTLTASSRSSSFPYSAENLGSWSRNSEAPIIAVEYSSGVYETIMGMFPVDAIFDASYDAGTDPDERGLIFSLPFPVRCIGMWVYMNISGANDQFTIKLYDSNGTTELEEIAIDNGTQGIDPGIGIQMYYFAGVHTLSKDTDYRISVTATHASSNISLYEFTVDAAAIMDAFEGGQSFQLTTANNGGSFSAADANTTRRPMMGIICDGFDDGVSSSGAAGHATLLGGMQ